MTARVSPLRAAATLGPPQRLLARNVFVEPRSVAQFAADRLDLPIPYSFGGAYLFAITESYNGGGSPGASRYHHSGICDIF
jgi:hypothetical protein